MTAFGGVKSRRLDGRTACTTSACEDIKKGILNGNKDDVGDGDGAGADGADGAGACAGGDGDADDSSSPTCDP